LNTTTFSWWCIARSLGWIYLALMLASWFLSDYLIFRPPHASYHAGGPYYRIPVTATESIGMLAITGAAPRYVLLYAHGNGEDLGPDLRNYLSEFCAHGLDVYAFDYRGYGISDGRPGTARACEDAEAAYQHLVRDRKIPPEQIILYGQLLGAALALDLAARHKTAGLIVESGFISAFRVKTVIPILPIDKFRNNCRMREVRCPVLVMHGMLDNVIPFWHGQELYRLAPKPKLAFWPELAGHCDIRCRCEAEYWRRLQEFLRLVDLSRSSAQSSASDKTSE